MCGKPQVSGVVLSTFTRDPVKPNSANRKVARVALSTGYEVTAYIPGEAHDVKDHDRVLVCPAKNPDLHGVRYRIIRGVKDSGPPERSQGRSKYGVKKTK